MILAQAVLQIFVDKVPWVNNIKVETGAKLCNDKSDGKDNIQVFLLFMHIPDIKFQDPISNRS